jgi:hypothetical protein
VSGRHETACFSSCSISFYTQRYQANTLLFFLFNFLLHTTKVSGKYHALLFVQLPLRNLQHQANMWTSVGSSGRTIVVVDYEPVAVEIKCP